MAMVVNKLVCADPDRGFCRSLQQALVLHSDFSLVGTAHDGPEAMALLAGFLPDTILVDPALPFPGGGDPLGRIRSAAPGAVLLAASHFGSEHTLGHCAAAGVDYFFLKPLDWDVLFRRCAQLLARRPLSASPLFQEASCLLLELGIPANIKGFIFLREVLLHTMERSWPGFLPLCEMIAQRHKTTPGRVERALRHALAVTTTRGGLCDYWSHKPTLLEFIFELVVRLQQRSGRFRHGCIK
ncbi:MAG: response regulator [Thermaerobacter sp.]|nr:response regulator [Thermaerobacter sp.]